jgi:hypothetical protein
MERIHWRRKLRLLIPVCERGGLQVYYGGRQTGKSIDLKDSEVAIGRMLLTLLFNSEGP